MWGSLAKIGISQRQERNVIWAVFARDGYKGEGSFVVPLLAEERLVEPQVQGVTLVRVDACLCRDESCLCIHSHEHCLRLGLSPGQEKSIKRNKDLWGKTRSAAGVSEVQHYKLKGWVFTLCSSKWCMNSPTLLKVGNPEKAYGKEKRTGKKEDRELTCKVKFGCSWISVFSSFQRFRSKFRVNQLF